MDYERVSHMSTEGSSVLCGRLRDTEAAMNLARLRNKTGRPPRSLRKAHRLIRLAVAKALKNEAQRPPKPKTYDPYKDIPHMGVVERYSSVAIHLFRQNGQKPEFFIAATEGPYKELHGKRFSTSEAARAAYYKVFNEQPIFEVEEEYDDLYW